MDHPRQNRSSFIHWNAFDGSELQDLAASLGEIISSVDEQYSLPEDKRLSAGLLNISHGCSEEARRGAASCCACLSNHRELVPNCTDRDVDSFVSTVLSSLFNTDDWRMLASADRVMPLLAEASPSVFLVKIERALRCIEPYRITSVNTWLA